MKRRALAMLLFFAAGGCGGPPVYRIRTNVPWPDQWASGPRDPERTDLALSPATVAWHRQTDPDRLRRQIREIASRHGGALVMVRQSFADRRGQAGKAQYALAYLEVRITAWPLPASGDATPRDWSFEDLPLSQAVRRCAEGMGAVVTLDRAIDPSTPVSFTARGVGAAEALALLLLQNDLYLAPTCLGTSVLRSYEYAGPEEFLRAVRRRLRETDAAQTSPPYVVMGLPDWAELHRPALQQLLGHTGASPGDSSSGGGAWVARARRYLLRMLELRRQAHSP